MATGKKTLDRALSRAGACSRAEAARAIATGRVAVNGRVVRQPDTWVDPVRDRLTLDGAPVRAVGKLVFRLHKPVGYVTTAADERNRATVYDLLPRELPWLGPVGRLDRDTSGLLLFTNDSDLAHAITAPASHLEKTYVATCEGPIDAAARQALADGVPLPDGRTAPARVTLLAQDTHTTTLELTLTEGRNRQVRRMVEAAGSRVLHLVRTRIGPLQLGDEPLGAGRLLHAEEVTALRAAVSRAAGRRC
jgi:23S rRNA pseudouridine2605 synthase